MVLYSFPSTKVTDRARGRWVASSYMIIYSILSLLRERQTGARREMKGWASSYM